MLPLQEERDKKKESLAALFFCAYSTVNTTSKLA